MYKKFAIISVLFLLNACSRIHYGYTFEQWELMSYEEQIVARHDFEKLEHEKYKLQHGDDRDNAAEAFNERALGVH